MNLHHPKSILITGASSGIGAALARCYAAQGITLHLGGRNPARLAEVGAACSARGATAHIREQDVTDRQGMTAWVTQAFAVGPIDLVIASAGISGGTGRREKRGGTGASESEPREQIERIFAVNVGGAINTLIPAMEAMRGIAAPGGGPRGQIALMSSLAGFRGLPGAPAYAASKAAVRSLGEGLRGIAGRAGIRVSVICPGFVKTPLTASNPYPMPFLLTAERAAAIIRRGLAADRSRIAFPWPLYALVWTVAALPPGLTDPILARLPRKPAI
ncbi:MAG TPA: SDR family NAD(P)-dependent oxidoreductase [Alphaproteobacteria bacterium]|jgi:NAD(P)-dependent dehydrogenase (short-subunit alcohol dehydrogenase family)